MLELRRELGDRFEHFQSLYSFAKSSYVLGCEAWKEYSSGLLSLIKEFVLGVWDALAAEKALTIVTTTK